MPSLRLLLAAVTAALSASAAHADMNFVLTSQALSGTTSLGFSNSTTAGTLTVGTLAPPSYNFLDRWSFTLADNADVSGLVATLNFTGAQGQVVQGIDNIELRLVGPGGGPPVVGWRSTTQFTGIQTMFSIVAPTNFSGGAYSLEVRGLLVGSASAYAGTLQTAAAVPVPAALPLLAMGLMGLAGLARRKRKAT